MKNQKLIEKVEEVKSILTETQKALEDGNLQAAGDCGCAAKIALSSVVNEIVKKFNNPS